MGEGGGGYDISDGVCCVLYVDSTTVCEMSEKVHTRLARLFGAAGSHAHDFSSGKDEKGGGVAVPSKSVFEGCEAVGVVFAIFGVFEDVGKVQGGVDFYCVDNIHNTCVYGCHLFCGYKAELVGGSDSGCLVPRSWVFCLSWNYWVRK